MNKPVISVVIPALNEEKVIGRCLASLAAQHIGPDQFEVIVVDNGSLDSTVAIARKFKSSLNLSVLEKKGSHVSAVRNLGAATARGQFLAFLDADCCAPPDWLGQAITLLQAGDGGVMGGYHSIPNPSSWLARAWYGDLSKRKQGPVSYIPCGTLLISRSVFNKVGGFDETLQTSEDFDLCQRIGAAGYQVLAYPALSTVHLGTPQTLRTFYRQQQWHGRGVRTVFLRDMLHPGFVKTFLLTGYTLFWTIASLLAIPIAITAYNFYLLVVGPAFLLFGATAMALRDAAQRRRFGLVFPLTILYLVYGLARCVSLLGRGRGRNARSVAPSLTGVHATTAPGCRSVNAPLS